MRLTRIVAGSIATLLFGILACSTDNTVVEPPVPPCLTFENYFHTESLVPATSAVGVCASGNLVFVADEIDGVIIYDVSLPGLPRRRSQVSGISSAEDIDVDGDLLVVACGDDGIATVDIGDPDRPIVLGRVPSPGKIVDVEIVGDRAYVVDSSIGLLIVDISDPVVPTVLGVENTVQRPNGVAIAGSIAWVAGGDGVVTAVNVANAASPFKLADIDMGREAHGISIRGDYVYVANSINGLRILNVADPRQPRIVGTIDTPGSALEVVLNTQHAFVADRFDGLAVIDISQPEAPVAVMNVGYSGLTADVFLSNEHLVIANKNGGVSVISANSLRILSQPPAVSHADGSARWITTSASHLFVADERYGVRVMTADKGTLSEVGALPMLQGPFYAVATDQTVYVANQDGVWEVDVSDPTDPKRGVLVPVSFETIAMNVVDNHMYMVKGPGPFTEIDLNLIDGPRGIDMSGLYVTRLDIIGDHIYSTSRTGLFNVIDRTSMTLINRVTLGGALQGITIMEVEGDLLPRAYAFIATSSGLDGPGIYVFDLLNRLIPSLVSFVRTSGDAFDVAIDGDVLYVAEAADGMEMFDISDIENIRPFGAIISPNGITAVTVFSGLVASAARDDGVIFLPVDGCLGN